MIDYIRLNASISAEYYMIAASVGIILLVKLKKKYLGVLIPYMFLVFAATVLSRGAGSRVQYHLILFWSYGENFRYQKNQILANIIMFIPIGGLLGFEKKRCVMLCGFIFSWVIELAQLITYRGMFELDDILHNTIGLLLGFFCVVGLAKMVYIVGKRMRR